MNIRGEYRKAEAIKAINNLRRIALYFLFGMELIFSLGYANEFEDHIILFIFSLVFFLIQFGLLYKLTPKRGITIMIAVVVSIHVFYLLAFVNDGKEIISNKYPAEIYYSTYWWVIAMLLGSIILDLMKIGILYLDRLQEIKEPINSESQITG